jgi:hypothetical protein
MKNEILQDVYDRNYSDLKDKIQRIVAEKIIKKIEDKKECVINSFNRIKKEEGK